MLLEFSCSRTAERRVTSSEQGCMGSSHPGTAAVQADNDAQATNRIEHDCEPMKSGVVVSMPSNVGQTLSDPKSYDFGVAVLLIRPAEVS